jgi:hypothetical protein
MPGETILMIGAATALVSASAHAFVQCRRNCASGGRATAAERGPRAVRSGLNAMATSASRTDPHGLTKNHHVVSQVEQRLNALNSGARPENQRIYEFEIVDRQ